MSGLNLTIYKDANITTATASKSTGLAENEESTLTITPATGKVFDKITVLSGGATANQSTKKVKMGSADAVVYVTGKDDLSGTYIVTEDTLLSINNTEAKLTRNTTVKRTASGAIYGVDVSGTAISSAYGDIVNNLVALGVLKLVDQ